MILPKAVLQELGVAAGTAMDVRVEEGKVVATPRKGPREGWAAAAADVAAAEEDPDEVAWQGFGNDGDDGLTW